MDSGFDFMASQRETLSGLSAALTPAKLDLNTKELWPGLKTSTALDAIRSNLVAFNKPLVDVTPHWKMIAPISVFDDLAKGGFKPFRDSFGSQLGISTTWAETIRLMQPPRPLMDAPNILGAYKDLLKPLNSTLGSVSAVADLRMDFLRGLAVEELQPFVELAETTPSLDSYVTSDASAADPLLAWCWKAASAVEDWLNQQVPGYWRVINDKTHELVVASLYIMFASLPGILFAYFGLPGFAVGIVLAGGAKLVENHAQQRLNPRSRLALGTECPTCFMPANFWCITVSGSSPGTTTDKLHRPRLRS